VALDQLDSYLVSEGPFDGVLGFSQGALLALLYILWHRNNDSEHRAPFRCAILLSLTGSVEQVLDILSLSNPVSTLKTVCVPTVMIWGQQDTYATSQVLLDEFWKDNEVWKFVHIGAHEMPGLSVVDSLPGAVQNIRRVIFQASNVNSN
jgi:hypothetical protein